MRKPLGHTIWFKLVLTILVFLPCYTQIPYESADTTNVIASVMEHPLAVSIAWLLPVLKFVLLGAIVSPFLLRHGSERVVLGYYAMILAVISFFQNMAQTDTYGFVWLISNTLVELVVLAVCVYDLLKQKSIIKLEHLNRKRAWMVPFMLLAFLMPYGITASGRVIPEVTWSILYNEVGVTYCMITPVIIGVLLLFSKGIHKPTLSVISYVGFLFGCLNMSVWFGLKIENWWMGVLHLPLLILAFYGLVVSHRERD